MYFISLNDYYRYNQDFNSDNLDRSIKRLSGYIDLKAQRNYENMIIVFTKYDILKKDYLKYNISNYCKDFKGNPKNFKDVKEYIIKKYLEVITPPKKVHIFLSDLTNHYCCKDIIDRIIQTILKKETHYDVYTPKAILDYYPFFHIKMDVFFNFI